MDYPDNKISETILEFGKVLISELPEPHTREVLESVLQIVIVVWNAVVIDQWNSTTSNVQEVKDKLGEMPTEIQLHVKRLIKRKQKRFGNDKRAVGRHWIREEDGEFIFVCDARARPDRQTVH